MFLIASSIRFFFIGVLVCCAIARANPADDQRSARMEDLIAQLSSDNWKTRQSAMENLVILGEDALPRLKRLVNATTDGEVRTRAAAAIAQIEDNRQIGPTLVTLHLQDVPPAQAYAELAKAAHTPLLTDPPDLLSQKGLKPVSLNGDREPLWKMLQSLSAQCDLEIAPITQRNREIGLGLTRGSADWQDKPTTLAGPLLIRADRLTRISTVRLRGGDVVQEFNITLTVFAEPKLKVLDYSGTIKLREIADDLGNSLIPQPGDGAIAANVDVFGNLREGTASRWEIGASLHYPKHPGTKIVVLKGSTALQVQTKSATLDLPLAGARNSKHTVGGIRMVVNAVDSNRLDLTIFRDGRTDAQWYGVRMQVSAGEGLLKDDKERIVARSQNGVEIDDSPDGQRMEIKIRFARDLFDDGTKASKKAGFSEATHLVWAFPTEVRELSVPFELRELPIP